MRYHRIVVSILFLYSVMLLVACNDTGRDKTLVSKDIVVQGSADIPIETTNLTHFEVLNTTNTSQDNTIPIDSLLPSQYVLLDYEIINLNNDDFDEYIMLYYIRGNPEVFVLIASYNTTFNKYQFIWQSVTSSYNTNDVHLEIRDMTGDFYNEILVLGEIGQETTLDIFYMKNPLKILSYENVFSITAKGIDFSEEDNTANESEFSNVIFNKQIRVYNTNDLDEIVREYYQWKENEFFLISSTTFSNTDLIKETLSQLHHTNNSGFQEFLSGIWIKQSNDEQEKILFVVSNTTNTIIVTIYNNEHVYTYDWQNSFRQIPRRGGIAIQISLKSRLLYSIYDWIQVEIVSDDSIYILGNENLPDAIVGEFRKIDSEQTLGDLFFLYENFPLQSLKTTQFLEELQGDFILNNQETTTHYIFDFPKLRIVSNSQDMYGYYNIFDLDSHSILEIQFSKQSPDFYILTQNNSSYVLAPVAIYADIYYENHSLPVSVLTRDKQD